MPLYLVNWAVIAIGLFGVEQSFAQDDSKPFTFGHVRTLQSDESVLAAIDLMGIEIERYQIELLKSRELRFMSYLYKNGKVHIRKVGRVGYAATSGKNELILIKYRHRASWFRFEVHMGDDFELVHDSGIVIRKDDDARYLHHTAKHPFALGELTTGKRIPFYVFAADPDRVTEFGPDETEDRIKQYIKENEWVVVNYVELR